MTKPRPARSIHVGIPIGIVAVMSLLTLATPSASATPRHTPGVEGLRQTANESTQVITLVTGDTVRITGPAGEQQVDVVPAPRADGARPTFVVSQRGGDVTVVPQDVAPLVPARLDPQLFDVTTLLAQGYGHSATRLIVTYRGATAGSAASSNAALPGTIAARALPSVHGEAVRVDAASVSKLGRTLDGLADPDLRPELTGTARDIDKIWLDQRVQVRAAGNAPTPAPTPSVRSNLAAEVPVAVLDSGIDATRANLDGRVAQARNFTTAPDVADRFGHGTRVAETMAAAGATLLSGKVVDDNGTGYASSVIAGMQWASGHEHAAIVTANLGLPAGTSDDPLSRAVERLTSANGTLFVLSTGAATGAGSAGTVGSTVDAPSALTVGPQHARTGSTNGADPISLTPDLTESTSLSAAQAAGAAARLVHRHPTLSAAQLKAELMGTARSAPGVSAYAQGAGRLDVAAASEGTLIANSGLLDLGSFSYPHTGRLPVRRELTYRNLADHDVTVNLLPAGAGGALTVTPRTLTIAAGGTAHAGVTVDTAKGGTGRLDGAITATASDGASTRTIVAFVNEEPMYDVTVNAVARDGRPGVGTFRMLDVDDGSVAATRFWPGSSTAPCSDASYANSNCIRVPAGTYSLTGFIFTMPPGLSSTVKAVRSVLNTSLVGNPQLSIDHDTTLTLDARSAKEVHVDTVDHPDAAANSGGALLIGVTRTTQNGLTVTDRVGNYPGAQVEEKFFEQPTARVTVGTFTAFTRWRLEQPALTATVVGKPTVPLSPAYYDPVWFSDLSSQYPRLNGTEKVRVIDIGTATPAEIAGHDLHGALALVRRSDAIPVGQQSNNAAAAGARMVAIYNDGPGDNPAPGVIGIRLTVPTVRLSHEQGVALLGLLASRSVSVTLTGHTASPYLYDLLYRQQGGVPDDPTFVADRHSLATVVRNITGQAGSPMTYSEVGYPFLPGETASYSTLFPFAGGPRQRTDYYVADPDIRWSYGVHTPEDPYNHLWPEPTASIGLTTLTTTTYRPGERRQDRWFGQPIASGLYSREPLQRAGNQMHVYMAAFIDSSGNWSDGYTTTNPGEPGFTTDFRVYAGDTLIAQTANQAVGVFTVPPDPATYRVDYDVDNNAPWAALSTHTSTEWTFHSAEPADGVVSTEPLLVADYDLDANLQNTVRLGGGPVQFGLNISHQAGGAQPAVTDVGVDASYDDGATWHNTQVRSSGAGHYVASIQPRVLQHRFGYVSLRVHAADADGSTFTQRIIRAFAVTSFVGPGVSK